MGGQVVDGNERAAEAEREALGEREADEQGAGQAGSLRDGHRVEIRGGELRLRQGLGGDVPDRLDMDAGGDLRDDPPVARMERKA